jgi:hypothetical protein
VGGSALTLEEGGKRMEAVLKREEGGDEEHEKDE